MLDAVSMWSDESGEFSLARGCLGDGKMVERVQYWGPAYSSLIT